MPYFEVVSDSTNARVYYVKSADRYVYHTPSNEGGQGATRRFADYTPKRIRVLGDALARGGHLFQDRDGKAIFYRRGKFIKANSASAVNHALPHFVFPVLGNIDVTLQEPRRGGAAAAEEDPVRELEMILQSNQQLQLVDWASANYAACGPIAQSAPLLRGQVQWPTVGVLPDGFLCTYRGKIAEHSEFPHLHALLEGYGEHLDDTSRARYLGFLLGCFNSRVFPDPIPLLWVDSSEPGVGKSELMDSIGYLLAGGEYVGCDHHRARQHMHDTLVAHCRGGATVVCIDNVQMKNDDDTSFGIGGKPTVPEWEASLIAHATAGNRTFAARGKHQGETSAYPGRIFIANGVYRQVSLSPALVTRTWRVKLLGEARAIPGHTALDYARENREALVSECYAAAKAAASSTWEPTTTMRAASFERNALKALKIVFPTLEVDNAQSEQDLQELTVEGHNV